MIYSVPDEKDRQDVIAYLKTLPNNLPKPSTKIRRKLCEVPSPISIARWDSRRSDVVPIARSPPL
jgi:hypothetical protein